ncbi:YgiQ family radical SAM protein [Clostridium estertheticum]|uniref:YgiQ family radical SAM protein n=1 Tax=Clostridium estertheticum TaxID=238834 RepID=UPI001CF19BB6|nr:YgiQ family radical SAM protein [Clostridium estertheticum]MCB2305167.1 YgiQ family radical SAM protein [Clostridium estertheticum]MCB2343563.1 YgiQ family radical SAM protein [Clostridium estertheticum]MCB2348483.1 YgiQ family radical SAM protein [Clostridium estertheticum]WAG47936.1 YgiQ family radical SAM protein [Clostridium estertheticum]
MVNKQFLPICMNDLKERNISQLDFIIITGDAYIDHPSFGSAIIGRTLEREGFTVGIIAQPDWEGIEDFRKLGKPKFAFIINSGNIDSMVNHYTAAKKKRHTDLYSPGGESGHRPDRAVIVYCNRAREAFKNVPIVIGGIEASLRRFAHYDYWSNKVRRSLLIDAKADLLLYGMGEKTVVEMANLFKYGMSIEKMTSIRGSVYATKDISDLEDYVEVPSFEIVSTDKLAYAESYKLQSLEQDDIRGKAVVQKHNDRYVVQNAPQISLTQGEMDITYGLPYTRTYHPIYEAKGGIPAIKEVEFSITSHRGCFGSCSFCALTFHQGRVIQNRSQKSIIDEAALLTTLKNFKGYIHDIGGPTANFRHRACKIQEKVGVCRDKQCMFPTPCKNLIIDHTEYLDLLRKVRVIPNIKKVFIRSGIRYDYLIYDKNTKFFEELCEHHISGQLKVAPEHISDKVLDQMGKSKQEVFDRFVKKYNETNKELDKDQFLVPYFMSSHPGCDLTESIKLSEYINEMGYTPEQVQDFYPTPGSLSTTIFYTGVNPFSGAKVYVPTEQKEKNMQRALMQFKNPENYSIVREALVKAHREDLIGSDKKSLIPSRPPKTNTHPKYQGKKHSKFRTTNTEPGHVSQTAPRTFTKPSLKTTSKPNLKTDSKPSKKRTSNLSPRKRQG